MLILLQVATEANWSSYLFDYGTKCDKMGFSIFYFDSFDLIMTFVLLSLMKGVVWEVFTVVEITQREHENIA